ncbi:hypothetical protein Tco_1144090 [Tanacetum coccineum]
MTLLQGTLSIQETSLIGSSLLAKTSIKNSSTPSVPTASPGLNREIFSMLMSSSIESWTPPHVFKNKTFKCKGMIMELQNIICVWPAPRAVEEEEEAEEEAKGDEGHDGAEGSTAMHRNISQCDWQVRQARWMAQQDEQWGRLNTWMRQQDDLSYWMYDQH